MNDPKRKKKHHQPKQGIKEQLQQEVKSNLKNHNTHNTFKDLWKLPFAKPIIIMGGLYGVLYFGKYVIRELAHFIEATKQLKKSVKK